MVMEVLAVCERNKGTLVHATTVGASNIDKARETERTILINSMCVLDYSGTCSGDCDQR